jgi:hypothetical protein
MTPNWEDLVCVKSLLAVSPVKFLVFSYVLITFFCLDDGGSSFVQNVSNNTHMAGSTLPVNTLRMWQSSGIWELQSYDTQH